MNDYQEPTNALIPNDDEEPAQMTLGGMGLGVDDQVEQPYDDQSAGSGGGLLTNTTLILIAVVLVAGGSLYAMRAMKGNLSSSDGDLKDIEAKIESTLSRLNSPDLLPDNDPLNESNLSALLTPTEDMTAIFEHDVRDQQVPIEDVKKDPFSLAILDGSKNAVQDTNRVTDRQKLEEKLSKEAATLDLQSIMLGKRHIAVIGGEFYKQGDRLGSFTVTGIDKFTVYLEAQGMPFKLSLESGRP